MKKNCHAGGNNTRPCCREAPAKVITMNVSGGNSKEIFELFTNKLVFLSRKNEVADPDSPSPH